MSDERAIRDEQFLIIAPIGRDAELIAAQLARIGVSSVTAPTDLDAVAIAENGIAGVILTEEAISPAGLREWERFVRAQPAWSDLPFLLLGGFGGEWAQSAEIERVREALGNVTILDRPFRARLLLSAVTSAMRARRRQFETRDAITAQREAEQALRHSEKLAVAGKLAATISHEINNPLSAVANLIFLAETKVTDDEIRRYLAMAQEELRRVSDIVRQTLRFHRAPTVAAETQISDVLDSSIGLFRHKLSRNGIHLVRDYDASLVAYCSSGEIRQAIVNVVGNAIDAMPAGGRLRVSARRLSNGARAGAVIFVADTGPGIPEHVRGRLFEQFFTTKASTGTGLGLWLTRDIIRRNNGRIRFRTRVTKPSGTVFSIWLPCEPTQAKKPPTEAAAVVESSSKIS